MQKHAHLAMVYSNPLRPLLDWALVHKQSKYTYSPMEFDTFFLAFMQVGLECPTFTLTDDTPLAQLYALHKEELRLWVNEKD